MEIDFFKTFKCIEMSEQIIDFSWSNIKPDVKINKKSLAFLKLDSPFFRVRLILYQLTMVGFCQMPIFTAVIIIASELSYLVFILFMSLKYFYMKNWIFLASKINSGLTILIISGISLYLGCT